MRTTSDPWAYEHGAMAEGHSLVCGCDEAGAGPLAGPVYAAAVVLPDGIVIPGLDDSKRLTERKREALFDVITEKAVAWAVASLDAGWIDRHDILSARMKAMQTAVENMGLDDVFVLVDGNRDAGRTGAVTAPHRCVVHGDALSASIAAASVLAKVSRDRHMARMDVLYPGYGFARHKGYGTKAHYAALRELGPCLIHRRSFLKESDYKR